MEQTHEVPRADDHVRLDAPTREHLQVLAEGAAALAGFELAAISVRRGEELEVVAGYGPGVADKMLGSRLPVALLEAEITKADDWGAWQFVPSEREGAEFADYAYVFDESQTDDPDAWQPRDLLAAPFRDEDGRLRGMLSVDQPRDGRRPGQVQREVLEKCAGVTRTAVMLALERRELAEQVRLASEAREIVRRALGEPSLDMVVAACRSTVVKCFGAIGMWLTAFDTTGGFSTAWYAEGAEAEPLFSEIDDVVIRLSHRYWADQYVAPFSHANADQPGLPADDSARLLKFLDGIGVGSVLFVPLGAGPECLGFLVLTRVSDARPWTSTEQEAALDIGRDLGRAVANARQHEQQRALVERLKRLDGYRVELVNTMAHELRNPLFSLTANLELLDVDQLGESGRRSVSAATKAANRMDGVIEDLLTMARMADPQRGFEPMAVDLRQVVLDVEEECHPSAEAASITMVTDMPDDPVMVPGLTDELHRMLANLCSNAVKYSDEGGRIAFSLVRDGGEVVLTVADDGIGIAREDQGKLFREFYRSSNPSALERPGTGLGLAIVERIVRRHRGRIDLASELGEGTTFTVTLPTGPLPGEDDGFPTTLG